MTSFLSLDPGLTHPAAALWTGGRLLRASRVKLKKEWAKECTGERCRLVGNAVMQWMIDQRLGLGMKPIDLLVVEFPQIYTSRKSKGDPNDLVPLAGICMALAGRLDVPVRSYTPSEWIGQCPKGTTGDPLASPRGKKIWSVLDVEERAGVVLSHDSLDAAGLGLHFLDRLSRRLYPGST